MNSDVVWLHSIATVQEVMDAIAQNHSGYPIKNMSGRLVGLIPTHILLALARNKVFYDQTLITLAAVNKDPDTCPFYFEDIHNL